MASLQPLQLVFNGIARQEPPRDAKSLVVHDQHFADRHAGRNGNPLKAFHVVSVARPATRANYAARASRPTCSLVCETGFVGPLAIEPDVRPATDSEKSASIQKRVAEQCRLGLRHRRVEYRSQK